MGACGSSDDEPSTEPDRASPSSTEGTTSAAPDPEPVELECEAMGYPCALADVPEDILLRSDELGDEALTMMQAGTSNAAIHTWLESQPDVVEIEADDDALRFRVEGGRGTWIFSATTLGSTRGSFSSNPEVALSPSTPNRPVAVGLPARPAFRVVGEDSKEKRALVLSPFEWDFGNVGDGEPVPGFEGVEHIDWANGDDGEEVAEILGRTRGYAGRVDFAANDDIMSQRVNVDSFKGWRDYDVIHVNTHGFVVCFQICRGAVSSGMLVGEDPNDPGVSTGKAFVAETRKLKERGLELGKAEGFGRRGLNLLPTDVVLHTADFFRHQYPGGLPDTFIFFNACESLTSGSIDLVDAVRGRNTVYLGWDATVGSRSATATSLALYEELATKGYPAQVAFEELGSKQFDPLIGANLRYLGPSGEEDLRIRDVLYLVDSGGEPLVAGAQVPIVGKAGDGEPDEVPYTVQVDGIKEEFAEATVLHVEVGNATGDPVPVSDGSVDENGRWTLTGTVPLGYDLEEDTEVTIRAWVELHSLGESEHEVAAILTSAGPIMGFVWELRTSRTITTDVFNSSTKVSAVLTLEFAEGQEFDEPHPRYVVTGGTVTYHAVDYYDPSGNCAVSAKERSYEATPSNFPVTDTRNFIEFDTTVTPVLYWNNIITKDGLAHTVTQNCEFSGVSEVDYGPNILWVNVSPREPVTDPYLITGSDSEEHVTGIVTTQVIREWTITRIK
jgi:hypothetical protein